MENRQTSRQGGQLLIEAVLLLFLFVTITMGLVRTFKSQKLLSVRISGPWDYVAGMIENGVWKTGAQGKSDHPNFNDRQITVKGEAVQ